MQWIAVGVILAATAVYIVLKIYRRCRNRTGGNSGCDGCALKDSCNNKTTC